MLNISYALVLKSVTRTAYFAIGCVVLNTSALVRKELELCIWMLGKQLSTWQEKPQIHTLTHPAHTEPSLPPCDIIQVLDTLGTSRSTNF